MIPPTPRSFRELLEDMVDIMIREESTGLYQGGFRRGGVVVIEDYRGLVAVIGDIHGDYGTFEKILEYLDKGGFMDNGLIVLLGDYIDRGPPEGQVLTLARIVELKKSIGWRLIALRGNHEPPRDLKPYPHDYPYALRELYGGHSGDLYELSMNLFNILPHALVLKGVALMLHGGPPTVLKNELLEYLGWNRRLNILEEILWNDPTEYPDYRAPSPRGAGVLWGPKVTEHALKVTGVNMVIRGHEAVYEGYKLNHRGKVVTLFTRLGPPYYNEVAAFIACDADDLVAGRIHECIKEIRSPPDIIETF